MEELRNRLRAGSVQLDSLVWSKGMAGWVPLKDLPAFNAEANGPKVVLADPAVPGTTLNSPGTPPKAARSAPSVTPPPNPTKDRQPDSGGTAIMPDAPLRGQPIGQGAPPPAEEAAPAAAAPAKKGGAPKILLVGVLGVGVLLAVILKGRCAQGDDAPLFSPCLSQSMADLTSMTGTKDLACADGVISARLEGGTVLMGLKGVTGNGLAAKTPELVAKVLPNLPAPSMARLLPLRQVLRLDLRGHNDAADRARVALRTYQDAEKLVEGYGLVGGHAFARWLLNQGRLDVENRITPDGPQLFFQLFPGEAAPASSNDEARGIRGGIEIDWDAPWPPTTEGTYLVDLRKAMLGQGWWFDDAEAFFAAAAADGVERSSAAGTALGVIADWLRHSDGWDARAKHTIWSQCFAPRMNTYAGTFSRERFDQLAGARDIEPFASPPDYHNAEEAAAVEGRLFNASIGSAMHAYCTIALADPFLDTTEESAANKILRHAPSGSRALAERLVKSPKFLASLGEELVKTRGALLAPGPPLM